MPLSVAANATTPGSSPARVAAPSMASIWENGAAAARPGACARAAPARPKPTAPATFAVAFMTSRRLKRWTMPTFSADRRQLARPPSGAKQTRHGRPATFPVSSQRSRTLDRFRSRLRDCESLPHPLTDPGQPDILRRLAGPLRGSMHSGQWKRRELIRLLGTVAAAAPLPARAQQAAVPVIGFLSPAAPDPHADYLRAFRLPLKESGYSDGDTVAIEYRWAENRMDRLPALAADLVRR